MNAQTKFSSVYLSKLLYKYAVVLLVLGALNVASIGLFRFNAILRLFGDGFFSKMIYGMIGVSALVLMFHRDTYLPF